ncbi:MAG TPA: PIN domain-containing protein [Thermoanaerobaculia bacterium]
MNVLVDTAVWSLALRRKSGRGNETATLELASLIHERRVAIIGPIRQELLSGIKERAQFDRLRDNLRAFSDTEITSADYEEAAAFYNRCREKGIQGSNTDFLICAVAVRREFSIYTTDEDFTHFARVLPIVLHQRQTNAE